MASSEVGSLEFARIMSTSRLVMLASDAWEHHVVTITALQCANDKKKEGPLT